MVKDPRRGTQVRPAHHPGGAASFQRLDRDTFQPFDRDVTAIQSISEISSCFFGPRPWHIEIRHRVKKNIHNEFVRIWDSQIENSKTEIMETDRIYYIFAAIPLGTTYNCWHWSKPRIASRTVLSIQTSETNNDKWHWTKHRTASQTGLTMLTYKHQVIGTYKHPRQRHTIIY